jgi:hypothetical protein
VRDELRLGECGLEIERAAQANAFGYLLEELVDRADAYRFEHLLAVLLGQRQEAHSVRRP